MINMTKKKGILRTKVEKAFEYLDKGDMTNFVMALLRSGDVSYKFHFDIVLDESLEQLKQRNHQIMKNIWYINYNTIDHYWFFNTYNNGEIDTYKFDGWKKVE